ncbi:MBL fold metallo-hydrolase [Salinisphaera japonica]|uniref:MBL fold metallo-hydrolase n=1 Tax=Salinisphaera japonica TaxID=1304270 RepID=UPI000F4BB2A0|nr:MBL fold metallo-hydrolase [Salinisphaera japonica]
MSHKHATDDPALIAGRPVRVAPGITRVLAPNPSPMTGPGTNSYIVGTRQTLIIDPGPDDRGHLDTLEDLAGPDIQAICLTHRHADHAAGAARLAEMTGAPIRAWPKHTRGEHDSAIVNDGPLADGERLMADGQMLTVWHSPGHAADHVVFAANTGLLLAGDTLMQAATVVILPPDGRMADYLATLDRLAELAPRRIAPAHGALIDNASGEIARVKAHRLRREAQIAALLGDHARSPEALVGRLYPELSAALVPVAARQVLAHLIHLDEQGAAVSTPGGWRAV